MTVSVMQILVYSALLLAVGAIIGFTIMALMVASSDDERKNRR